MKDWTTPKPLTFGSKLTFGKYEGHTIRHILNNDPTYLEWVIDQKIITLHPKTQKEIEAHLEAYYDDRYDGLSWGDLEF